MKGELDSLNTQISNLQNDNERLQSEIDSLKKEIPAKIEKVAREKYDMIKEGERTIELKKSKMAKNKVPDTPLAERIRPKSLDEFYGQEILSVQSKPIRLMIEHDNLSSFILWGPPGSGKTTLAKIIAEETQSEFFRLTLFHPV